MKGKPAKWLTGLAAIPIGLSKMIGRIIDGHRIVCLCRLKGAIAAAS
ncbi:MAG: hypothetical protein OEM29_06675 [Thermoplasmata archaeon]|nr:hypothetical protein [Thermoplasmata archaeon]